MLLGLYWSHKSGKDPAQRAWNDYAPIIYLIAAFAGATYFDTILQWILQAVYTLSISIVETINVEKPPTALLSTTEVHSSKFTSCDFKFDTGANVHIVNSLSAFSSYLPKRTLLHVAGGEAIVCTHIGTVDIHILNHRGSITN